MSKHVGSVIGFVVIPSPGGKEQATGMKLKIKLASEETQRRLVHI